MENFYNYEALTESQGRRKAWRVWRRNKLTLCPKNQGEWVDLLKDTKESSRLTKYFKLSTKILMLNEHKHSR